MRERAGSRTPEAPRGGARGCRFCRTCKINRRAVARSLRPAKLGAPRVLCVGHVRQFGGESPLCNLMEVKH